jgi:hypothetical protein
VPTAAEATAALYAAYFHETHTAMRTVVNGLSPALLDWKPGEETNSIAALIAHTLDSERALTAIVAGVTLPRDREAAFRVNGLDAEKLVAMIEATEREVDEGTTGPDDDAFVRAASGRTPRR